MQSSACSKMAHTICLYAFITAIITRQQLVYFILSYILLGKVVISIHLVDTSDILDDAVKLRGYHLLVNHRRSVLINHAEIRITQTMGIHGLSCSLTSSYRDNNHQNFQFYPLHTP